LHVKPEQHISGARIILKIRNSFFSGHVAFFCFEQTHTVFFFQAIEIASIVIGQPVAFTIAFFNRLE
jgi:hypothetical protein